MKPSPRPQFRLPLARLAGAALLGALWLSAPAHATPARYEFEVLLDGKPVGSHRFEVVPEAGGRRITSEARMEVKFLGLALYRYRHEARESWRERCLARIDATTSDNGRSTRVNRSADTGCISTYAYWDRDLLLAQRELLNPQTGEIDPVQFESLGSETIQVRGRPVTATRHRLRTEKYTIDLWYSPAGEWLQLESTAGGDRRLLYRLRG